MGESDDYNWRVLVPLAPQSGYAPVLGEFLAGTESIDECKERFELYCTANGRRRTRVKQNGGLFDIWWGNDV